MNNHADLLREMRFDPDNEGIPEYAAALDAAIAALAKQPAAEPTNEAVAEFRRFLNGKQPVDGKITMKQARHILREWPAQQPAAVGVPVDVVREYLDARACYEEATRRPNSHAPAPVLKHDGPDARRLREARVALDNAIAFAQQPADPITAYYTDRNRAGWAAPRHATAADTNPSAPVGVVDVDALAQEIRRVDGDHNLGAGALAEALMPYLAQQPAAVDEDWRKKAAEWLEAKAVEQEAANKKWPEHAARYKAWRDRPNFLRYLAFQVLAGQQGGESE